MGEQEISVTIQRRTWFQGNDDKTLQVQKRESVWFEFLGSINRTLRVYFLSG